MEGEAALKTMPWLVMLRKKDGCGTVPESRAARGVHGSNLLTQPMEGGGSLHTSYI